MNDDTCFNVKIVHRADGVEIELENVSQDAVNQILAICSGSDVTVYIQKYVSAEDKAANNAMRDRIRKRLKEQMRTQMRATANLN